MTINSAAVPNNSINIPKFNWGWVAVGVLLLSLLWGVGVYNGMIGSREEVRKARSDIQVQYQRRFDVINGLIATVQGAADFEKTTLQAVVEARAKATSINVNVDNLTPEKLKEFEQSQGQLNSALGRLIAVAEQYPNLTATQNFRDFQVQLEGTENRVQVAREKYNSVVRPFNTSVQVFPGSIISSLFGFQKEALFEASGSAQEAPKVQFNNSPSSSARSNQ